MKKMKAVFAILSAILLTACQKEKVYTTSATKATVQVAPQAAPNNKRVYATGWETVTGWTLQREATGAVFSVERPLPQLSNAVLNGGVVAVFVRNLWGDEPESKGLDEPLELPLNFLPYNDQPNYTEQWQFACTEQKLRLSVQIAGATNILQPYPSVQFRCILIPASELKSNHQHALALQQLPYYELAQRLGIRP